MKNNYLLENIDDISFKLKVKELTKNLSFNEAIVSTYNMDEVLLDRVLEDLDTYSFLSDKKTIIVKNLELMEQDGNSIYFERFLKYLDNPSQSNLLIITVNSSSSSKPEIKKFIKDVKKKCNAISYKVDAEVLIKNILKDYKLEPGVIKLISDKCLLDSNAIMMECLKLKDYKLLEKNITKEDVELLVRERFIDSTDITFDFSRALAENDKKEALRLWKKLLCYQGVQPLELIGLIGSQFRIMYQVKLLDMKKMNSSEIAKILEAHPYRITKTRELNRYYNLDDIGKIIVKLAKLDLDIKTTACNPEDMLEMFILNM